MSLFLKATELKLKTFRGVSPLRRLKSSSAVKRCLKKSRSENSNPACESAALAVLQVPQPPHQYKLMSGAIYILHMWASAARPLLLILGEHSAILPEETGI
jgi:hypothetical protein